MFDNAQPLIDEFRDLEQQLADPELHADVTRSRKVGRRYAALRPIVEGITEFRRLTDDRAAAAEPAADDASFADEVAELDDALEVATGKLTKLLAPRDPNDDADALVEIKSGEGGDESALFAGDLLKMYSKYAEQAGWKVRTVDRSERIRTYNFPENRITAGSGAITAALARECGGLDLHAVEISPEAYGYLTRNLAHVDVRLALGDMADAFTDLDATVDLVIANPPYVPENHRALLPSDVVDHDPALALFSRPDGLDAPGVVARVARRLLRPGGLVAMEHDESHADAVRGLFSDGFRDVVTRMDLTGRPRYVTGERYVAGLTRD